MLLAGTTLGKVHICDTAKHQSRKTISIENEEISALEFTSDGSKFLAQTGHWDGSVVKILAADTGEPVFTFTVMEEVFPATAVAMSPDGKHVAAGGFFGGLWLMKTTNDDSQPPFGSGGVRIDDVLYSPDGKYLLTVEGASAGWFDVATNERKGFARHADTITMVTFSSDGGRVATASEDGVVRVWSVADGKPVGGEMRHDGPVRTLALGVGLSHEIVIPATSRKITPFPWTRPVVVRDLDTGRTIS